MPKKLCISICGGGYRGLWVSQFLSRLESDLGKSIAKQVKAVAGTSTGSIIAAGLAEGLSATEICDLYVNKGAKIFTKYPAYKRILPKYPTYDNTNLKKILQEVFKGKMSDFKIPVFIPVTYMNGQSVEKVWDKGDDNIDKWFAVLTSCSAPTYFDVVVKDGKSYCDGGLNMNDPCMALESGLKKEYPKFGDFKVLCFNTGGKQTHEDTGNKTLVGWAEYFIDNVGNAGDSNYFELCANLGEENVFRVNPKVGGKMDDVSKDRIAKLIEIGNNAYDSCKDELKNWLKK